MGAELARETTGLKDALDVDLDELTRIYVGRGLNEHMTRQVSVQLTRKDSLVAFARDVFGKTAKVTARPIQATVISAMTFVPRCWWSRWRLPRRIGFCHGDDGGADRPH